MNIKKRHWNISQLSKGNLHFQTLLQFISDGIKVIVNTNAGLAFTLCVDETHVTAQNQQEDVVQMKLYLMNWDTYIHHLQLMCGRCELYN